MTTTTHKSRSKTLGLTPAMRKALELIRDRQFCGNKMLNSAIKAEFVWIDIEQNDCGLTPRGHAALAAPKMTQAEYEYLEFVDHGHWRTSFSAAGSRVRWQCIEKRWIRKIVGASDRLTPSGHKALNDVRAAIGSVDYKEST